MKHRYTVEFRYTDNQQFYTNHFALTEKEATLLRRRLAHLLQACQIQAADATDPDEVEFVMFPYREPEFVDLSAFTACKSKFRKGKKSTIKFHVFPYADISTSYIPDSDLPLISEEDAPRRLAESDDKRAVFFYLPDGDHPDAIDTFASDAREFGLSERFIEIMKELSAQGIPYVRFDGDGEDVEGLEPLQ